MNGTSRFASLVVLSTLLAAGGCADTGRPDGLYAEMHTSKGLIVARLAPEYTPLAVANFVGLAEGTIENAAFDPGRPFYDGSIYHRVVPGHVIQTGSAASERSSGPGYSFPNEIHAALSHDHAGALNQANGGPHTNGSQFTITLGDRSYLDWDYIVFGDVVEGIDVVMTVEQGDVLDSVRIVRVGREAEAYRPTTESFRALVAAAEERVARDDARKPVAQAEWIAERYPELSGPAEGVRWQRVAEGARTPAAEEPRRVRYSGERIRFMGHVIDWDGPELVVTGFGSDEEGAPGFNNPPEAFTWTPGETRINDGVDQMIGEMSVGERRVVVVPAEFGYGRGGLYLPEVPGEPRFIIPPNTLLVYELEVLEEGR